MNLLQMSFSGAAFITAVVIIRAVAINKLPKKTFLVLWELVILRLLIPFSIPSMFSVYTLVTHSISSTTLPEAGTDIHQQMLSCRLNKGEYPHRKALRQCRYSGLRSQRKDPCGR